MIYVALTALAVAAVTVASTGALLRSFVRQQARERQLLIDQICHLAGRTWNDPPARAEPEPPDESSLLRSPEQWPEDELEAVA